MMKTKILQTIAGVLIAIILVVGGVIGLSIGLRSYRAAVQLDDITVGEGTVVYLASVYKMTYDGENFEEDFKAYLADMVADAYLYAFHHGYKLSDMDLVDKTTKKVLDESAGGNVKEFNDVAKEHGYGFTYTDFKNATALKFKADEGRRLMPEALGEEGYANAKAEALGRINFTDRYSNIDFSSIPDGHEYYVK
jgi:hypothetical protein